MYVVLRNKVQLLLDPAKGGTRWNKLINSFIITLIILNIIAVIIETVDSIYLPNKVIFKIFASFSVIIFSVEYLLRLLSCTSKEKYRNPVVRRLKYIFSAGAIIDLLAILPFYLPLFAALDLRFIRILRLTRGMVYYTWQQVHKVWQYLLELPMVFTLDETSAGVSDFSNLLVSHRLTRAFEESL